MKPLFNALRDGRKALLPALLLVAGVYLFCMPAGVTFEDAGEFAVAARTLGVAHPPGYPLYVLTAHLFSRLPLGADPATGTNLFSLLSALAGLFLLFYVLRGAAKDSWLALSAVLLTAFSRTFWNTSLITEVYLLNFFFWILLSWMALRYFEPDGLFQEEIPALRTERLPLAGAFLFGLALGNHQMLLFMAPALLVLFSKTGRRPSAKTGMLCLLLGILGLLIYAYLPIRAAAKPYLNWGDPSTWQNFRNVFFREQYGDIGWGGWDWKILFRQLLIINPLFEYFGAPDFQNIHRRINYAFLFPWLLTFVVAVWGWHRDTSRRTKVFLLLTAVLFGPFLVFFTRTPANKEFTLKVFFLPFWAVFGFYFLKGLLEAVRKFAPGRERFVLLLPLLPLMLNLRVNNFRNYPYTADYTRNMLNSLPLNAVLFTLKDNETFPSWHYQGSRLLRPDAAIVNHVSLSERWYREKIRRLYPEILARLPDEPGGTIRERVRAEFFGRFFSAESPGLRLFSANREIPLPEGFGFRPWGNLYRLVRTNQPPPPDFFPVEHVLSYRELDLSVRQKHYDVMTLLAVQTYAVLAADTGHMYREAGEGEKALFHYDRSARFHRLLDFEINNFYNYYFTGLIHLGKGRKDLAIEWWRKAVALQPSSQAAGEIRTALAGLERPLPAVIQEAERLYHAGQYREAIPYYHKSLAQGEIPAERAYGNIGDCHFNMQDYREAALWYKKALDVNPQYLTAYYNLGGAYLMTGRREEAFRVWREGLRRDPQNALISKAIEQYGGGRP